MVPWALGTQTAGSIVRPASYNGVYGFKPSYGAIPRTGHPEDDGHARHRRRPQPPPRRPAGAAGGAARARLQLPAGRALARREPRPARLGAPAGRAAGRGPRRDAVERRRPSTPARRWPPPPSGSTPPAPRSCPTVLPAGAAARARRARDDLRARAGVLLQHRGRAARDPLGELPRRCSSAAGRSRCTSTPRRSTPGGAAARVRRLGRGLRRRRDALHRRQRARVGRRRPRRLAR